MNRTSSKQRLGIVLSVVARGLLVGVLAFVLSQAASVRGDPGFDPEADITLSNYNSDVNADIASHFAVYAPDVNFGQVVTYTPPDWFVASDADVPDGTEVGNLQSVATLALMNGPCNMDLSPYFVMYDATTDTSNSFTYDPATEPIGTDKWPGYEEVCPDGHERAVCEYPDFLNDLFPGITPRARYYGHVLVTAVATEVALQFVVFEPGTSLPGGLPSSPDWGYPSVTVLNDPTAPLGPGATTDFCTDLISDNTVYGEADSLAVRTNPEWGGTYTFRSFSRGLPDADGDGYENDIDTCPFDPNLDGDPRTAPVVDNDRIDSACDPAPLAECYDGAPGNFVDCDDDEYWNRGDNCPMVANGPDEDNQADADSDGIGDACDTEGNGPNSVDGAEPEVTIELEVDIIGPERPAPGADGDDDGVEDTEELALGSCFLDPCGDEFCSDTEPADSTPEHTTVTGTCTDALDNDKDGYVDDHDGGCGDDEDGDGVSDDGEDEFGSDPDDSKSTPEDARVCDVCTDGLDNDGDGDTDAADDGCAVAATPTPTPAEGEATPTPEATPTATPMAPIGVEDICSPVIPGTYYGLVDIDGKPAADGYKLTASIDGTQWADTIVSGGRYAMDIPDYLPAEPPCFEGGTIVFELNGMACTPAEAGADQFAAGLQNVDLDCAAPATPVATPPPAATPTPAATPAPATPTATPAKPPVTGAGSLAGPSQGLPLWAMALAGWVGLMTVAGLGTLVAVKRR